MNAADVLADAHRGWVHKIGSELGPTLVAALLAHGEQGVAILPDGTLTRLARSEAFPDRYYELVPLSAEAGDPKAKDASHGRESDTGNWMGGGLEITYPSAEAGDTDRRYDEAATRDLARSLLDDDEPWFVASIREPWYIALARAMPDPQVEHPLAAIQAVLDDYGLEVLPLSAEAGDTDAVGGWDQHTPLPGDLDA